ncbi:MAG: HD domain-containing protein [Bacteroidota bacterium]
MTDYNEKLKEENSGHALIKLLDKMEILRQDLQEAHPQARVSLLFQYMKEKGQAHYEEDVSQYQHALQSAALAARHNANYFMLSAALLHDMGHMLAEDLEGEINPTEKDDFHENLGASFLSEFFPASVTEPIRLHVEAKRYICTTDQSYFKGLSSASQKSFMLQGGKMDEQEQKAFENHPHFQEAIQLRKWDDQAKTVGLEIPEIEVYESVLLRALKV